MRAFFTRHDQVSVDWANQCYLMCFAMLEQGLGRDIETKEMGSLEDELFRLLDKRDLINKNWWDHTEEDKKQLELVKEQIGILFDVVEPNAIKSELLKRLPRSRSMELNIPEIIPHLVDRGMRLSPEEAYLVMRTFGIEGPNTLAVLRNQLAKDEAAKLQEGTVQAAAPARRTRL